MVAAIFVGSAAFGAVRFEFAPDRCDLRVLLHNSDVLDSSNPSGFWVEDANSGIRERITAKANRLGEAVSMKGEARKLGLKLDARMTARNDVLSIRGRVVDLTKSERAIRVYFTMNVKDLGWTWCQDINNSTRATPGQSYTNPGGYAGFKQSVYPFAAVCDDSGAGIAWGWPMSAPQFCTQTFSVRKDGTAVIEVMVPLGLSSHTANFPNSADFDLVLYAFDGKGKFRSAAARYYSVYPKSFRSRAKKQGLWALWVAPGTEEYAKRMGVIYHEAEFALDWINQIVRDDKAGFQSFTYSEPWGSWYPLPKGFKEAHPGAYRPKADPETALDPKALEAAVRADFGDASTSDRYPGATRDTVARAIVNSAVEGDQAGDWMVYFYSPGFGWGKDRHDLDTGVFILNPDPNLPHPNRADLCWDNEILYVRNEAKKIGGSLDGVYLDSAVFNMAWNRFDFRKDHWKYAKVPLVYTRLEDGSYVPAQALALGNCQFLREIRGRAAKYGWPILINGWSPLYAVIAANVDILGAGETFAGAPLVDQQYFAEFRTMAYRKPVVIMDYALSLHELEATQKNVDEVVEPRINYLLMYGTYPGTANAFDTRQASIAKLKLVTPVFEKYRDLFLAINKAGWEPAGYASCDADHILLEQWGNNTGKGFYYTLYNESDTDKTVTVKLNLPRNAGHPSRAKELVTGRDLSLDNETSFSIRLTAKRTALVQLL